MYVLIIERTGELVRDRLGRVVMVDREGFAHKLDKLAVQKYHATIRIIKVETH